MSDTLPNEVREAMARALVAYNTIPEFYEREWPKCLPAADAALSALEAAGFEVNRKGTIAKICEPAVASEQRIAAVYDLIVKARDLLRSCEHLSPAAGLSRQAYARVQDVFEALQNAKYAIAVLLTASNLKEKPDV